MSPSESQASKTQKDSGYSFSYRGIEKPRDVKVCQDSFYTPQVVRPNHKALSGVISLTISLGEPFSRSFPVRINREHQVNQLKKEIKKAMDSTNLREEVDLREMQLLYANQPVHLESRICDVVNIPDLCRINVVFDWSPIRTSGVSSPTKLAVMEVTEDMLPRSATGTYKIYPTRAELCRMTPEELGCLNNFRVYNQFGEICFQEPINAIGLDVDRLVHIEKLNLGIISQDLLAEVYGFDKDVKFVFREVDLDGRSELSYKTSVLRYLQRLDGKLNHWDMANRMFTFTVCSNSLY